MLTIAPMDPAHWPTVRRIYQEGIATGMATFETEAPDWAAWDAGHLATPRLVADLETLFSSVHSDNAPSLALHAAWGFRTVGRRERIARRADGWCDTVIMERRSDVVGID